MADQHNAESDRDRFSPTKLLSSFDCQDKHSGCFHSQGKNTSVYSSAQSLTSKFDKGISDSMDSADSLQRNDVNPDIQQEGGGLLIRKSLLTEQVWRNAWKSTLAWRILHRLIQRRILADHAKAEDNCRSETPAIFNAICKNNLCLDITEVSDEEIKSRPEGSVQSDSRRASDSHSALIDSQTENSDVKLRAAPKDTLPIFHGDHQGSWYTKKEFHMTSSSFNNSLHLLSVAVTAANSGLTNLKSVLKVSKAKLRDFGHVASGFSNGSNGGAEHLYQKQTSMVKREAKVNVRVSAENKAKLKMHWYSRNGFHRICLTLVRHPRINQM
jgi:hypothetical protein